jgi:hypothetical protein
MWHCDDAPWSSLFARRVAETIGYAPPGATLGADKIPLTVEAEQILHEVTEAFRYLPPKKIQLALDFAAFLRAHGINGGDIALSVRSSEAAKNLNEARDLILFLRSRFGEEEPADEKDYWTEEDRQEATLASLRYAEETMPYDWGETEAGQGVEDRKEDKHA